MQVHRCIIFLLVLVPISSVFTAPAHGKAGVGRRLQQPPVFLQYTFTTIYNAEVISINLRGHRHRQRGEWHYDCTTVFIILLIQPHWRCRIRLVKSYTQCYRHFGGSLAYIFATEFLFSLSIETFPLNAAMPHFWSGGDVCLLIVSLYFNR